MTESWIKIIHKSFGRDKLSCFRPKKAKPLTNVGQEESLPLGRLVIIAYSQGFLHHPQKELILADTCQRWTSYRQQSNVPGTSPLPGVGVWSMQSTNMDAGLRFCPQWALLRQGKAQGRVAPYRPNQRCVSFNNSSLDNHALR